MRSRAVSRSISEWSIVDPFPLESSRAPLCPRMPIYEFFCPQTNKIYSFYARSLAMADKTPRCPDNPKFRMERMISSFSFTGRKRVEPGGSAAGPPGSETDDPRMEQVMAEMERDFSGMDEENPDPKRLA